MQPAELVTDTAYLLVIDGQQLPGLELSGQDGPALFALSLVHGSGRPGIAGAPSALKEKARHRPGMLDAA